MKHASINILIGGEAGQGLVTLSQILIKGLVRSGYYVVVTQGYQSRIRGGHNWYPIRVSDSEIIAPTETVNLLIALDQNSVALHMNELSKLGLVLTDEAISSDQHPQIVYAPFTRLAGPRSAIAWRWGRFPPFLAWKKML